MGSGTTQKVQKVASAAIHQAGVSVGGVVHDAYHDTLHHPLSGLAQTAVLPVSVPAAAVVGMGVGAAKSVMPKAPPVEAAGTNAGNSPSTPDPVAAPETQAGGQSTTAAVQEGTVAPPAPVAADIKPGSPAYTPPTENATTETLAENYNTNRGRAANILAGEDEDKPTTSRRKLTAV